MSWLQRTLGFRNVLKRRYQGMENTFEILLLYLENLPHAKGSLSIPTLIG